MNNKLLRLIFLFNILSLSLYSQIPTLSNASQVSLLTCTPSDEAVYALFGHSGLRIQDDSLGIDYVFDYGLFDFESENFYFRFVKGETDYMVGIRSFDRFMLEYRYGGRGVTEQVFSLSLAEKQNVTNALFLNIAPENRVYRYNFFYDNCATRPRDIIASSIEGQIDYVPFTAQQTYRDLLDECLILTPWTRFGINIVIGSGADKIITERQKDFIPLYISTAFSKANIEDQRGNKRKLVAHTSTLLEADGQALNLLKAKANHQKSANTPLFVGIFILLMTTLLSYLSYYKQHKVIAKVFDSLLFLIAGVAGCIIFFLMFFSEHPCVDANWNFVWLNPLALFFVPFFFVKSLTKYVISYHFVNFALLTLFLVGIPFIPQTIEIAFIPYILALCIRSGINILEYRNSKYNTSSKYVVKK